MLTGSLRLTFFLYFFILLTQLSGCVSIPSLNNLDANGQRQVEITETPYFSQRRKQCGAAALATVLNYHDVAVTAIELEDYVYIPGREGAVSVELMAQSRRYGMLAYPLNGSMDNLFSELRAGNPVIVLQNLGLSWLPQWHFAVAVGYDFDNGVVLLRSGNQRRRKVPLKTFYTTWARSDFWGLVVVPPDQIPASATALTYMKAASALEEVGKTEAARKAYMAALSRWEKSEQSESIRLGLANIEYGLGRFGLARQWLVESINRDVATEITWNNLAYVLNAQHCNAQAIRAVDCAISRAKSNDVSIYRESREELLKAARDSGISTSTSGQQCNIPSC